MSGYEASDMSDEQFQRKRQLCQDVLGQWFLTFYYTLPFLKIFWSQINQKSKFFSKLTQFAIFYAISSGKFGKFRYFVLLRVKIVK